MLWTRWRRSPDEKGWWHRNDRILESFVDVCWWVQRIDVQIYHVVVGTGVMFHERLVGSRGSTANIIVPFLFPF